MLALVVDPGTRDSARVEEVPALGAARGRGAPADARGRRLRHRPGDRPGVFGVAPEGEESLVLGHESLAVVERDGHGFSRGDLVTATVRRSCGHCIACAEGAPDSCLTGDYRERGITRLHGWARELVAEDPAELVAVPPALGRLGVLSEPTSICARALRHARAIGGRQPWQLERALVLGAGAVGMLSTLLLRLADVEVWTAAREPSDDLRAELAGELGARYVSTAELPVGELRAEAGGFDLVVEATGRRRRDGRDARPPAPERRRVPARDRPARGPRRAGRQDARRRRGAREPRPLRERERAAAGLARRRRRARPGARPLAGDARAADRPARPARPLRGRVRPPGVKATLVLDP